MTSSLLHSVPNACTVQPKAWPAGDAVTVADSEPIRTLHFEERAELGRRLGGRPRSPGQGVSRNSTWPWAPAIVQAAAAGLRWAISFAHQHLLFHPFAAA
jgi:hypothetical protein